MSLLALLPVLVSALSPVVVAGVRKVVPKIPKVLLPVASVLVGAVAGYASDLGVLVGAQYGAVGVAVREVLDQAVKAITSDEA